MTYAVLRHSHNDGLDAQYGTKIRFTSYIGTGRVGGNDDVNRTDSRRRLPLGSNGGGGGEADWRLATGGLDG